MCGGGGGIIGGISSLLFGKPENNAPEMPKVEAPAPPAPSRKQDTGAIVKVGDSGSTDRLSGNGTGGVRRKSGSSLGNLGSGGLSI